LFYRLREAEKWLERVLARVLLEQVGPAPPGWRLRVVDATVVTGPGSKGTEWRAHVCVDPAAGAFRAVELTDSHGGEGLARHVLKPGEVVLGDRAYATAQGLYSVKQSGAQAVVRLNPYTIRVCRENREKFRLLDEAANVPQTGAVEMRILVPVPPLERSKTNKPWPLEKTIAWIPARVLAARTRKGEVIWVLTTLDAAVLTPTAGLQLYRFRWQVELCFKRLKSLLHLDTLPSRQGPTAKSWMLARFIAAALAQRLVRPAGSLSPWGYQLR
jgi:hypothetical protein